MRVPDVAHQHLPGDGHGGLGREPGQQIEFLGSQHPLRLAEPACRPAVSTVKALTRSTAADPATEDPRRGCARIRASSSTSRKGLVR